MDDLTRAALFLRAEQILYDYDKGDSKFTSVDSERIKAVINLIDSSLRVIEYYDSGKVVFDDEDFRNTSGLIDCLNENGYGNADYLEQQKLVLKATLTGSHPPGIPEARKFCSNIGRYSLEAELSKSGGCYY
ncbi:MAG TPA: hypothetical protein VJC39_00455 [Candidatus Nanoarchaeia archaeon]|nr:hypothetical protein [Candidatus Nanoarchaeia archaeon]